MLRGHCKGGVPWHLDVTDALSQTPILFVSGKCDRTNCIEHCRQGPFISIHGDPMQWYNIFFCLCVGGGTQDRYSVYYSHGAGRASFFFSFHKLDRMAVYQPFLNSKSYRKHWLRKRWRLSNPFIYLECCNKRQSLVKRVVSALVAASIRFDHAFRITLQRSFSDPVIFSRCFCKGVCSIWLSFDFQCSL